MTSIEEIETALWPDQIQMSGLPFGLHGWNCNFYKNGQVSDGCPVYKLDSYWMYHCIGIMGASIQRIDGFWVLKRDEDCGSQITLKKIGQRYTPDPSPFGEWTCGGRVTSVYNSFFGWRMGALVCAAFTVGYMIRS